MFDDDGDLGGVVDGVDEVEVRIVRGSRASFEAAEERQRRGEDVGDKPLEHLSKSSASVLILQLIMQARRRTPTILMKINTNLRPPLLPRAPEILLHAALHLVGQDDHILHMQ